MADLTFEIQADGASLLELKLGQYLIGEKGDQGPPGQTGQPGPQGPTGELSPTGLAAATAAGQSAGTTAGSTAGTASGQTAGAAAGADAATTAVALSPKTSGLGDWSPESTVFLFPGDSTTELMGGAGYGMDSITRYWRGPGMPLEKLLACVNFGGSGVPLFKFVGDPLDPTFVGPTGAMPGVTAGPGNWDYFGHKPTGEVSLATCLAWRAALPTTVKQAIWVICYGINDLILYNTIGNGTPAQIAAALGPLLDQAINGIQAAFPADLIVLQMPNTMSSRPFVSSAGYPSLTAYPNYGQDDAADAALVDNWNQGLALTYVQAQSRFPRTTLIDMRPHFGYSSTALTAIPAGAQTAGGTVNANPRLQNLVHPATPGGYDAKVHTLCNALVGTTNTRAFWNPIRDYADLLVTQGYTGNPWDNYGLYFQDNQKYRKLGSFRLVSAGSTFMVVATALANVQAMLAGLGGNVYAQVAERSGDAIAVGLGAASTLNVTASASNAQINGTGFPATISAAVGATVTFYTDAANTVIPSGNAYLIGLTGKFNTYRYQIVGKVTAAGNGFLDFTMNANQNHASSRFFQPSAAMVLAVGGNINASQSLSGFTKLMNGAASARSMRLFKSGTDFSTPVTYAGADAVILFDDNAPNQVLQELEQPACIAGALVASTSIFGCTPTRMSGGLASITLTNSLAATGATVVAVYRHSGNVRTLIATLTIGGASFSVTGVSGTDFTAIATILPGEVWEFVPTSVTGPQANTAIKMTLTPAI